jgi:hypothetical protein|tara:strand:- start:517 stop:741 length:225 start_codon:yes stop_codon:yes gene_type:complete
MVAEIKSEDKDMVSKIIQYEAGNMNAEETIEFFQELIDTGMAYTLQGHYGRTATYLLVEGLCTQKKRQEATKQD